MEVKIGVSDSPREIVFNSAQTPGEVEDLVQAALAGAGTSAVLALTDDKGKRILVQAPKISYVEIGAPRGPSRAPRGSCVLCYAMLVR